MESLDDVIDALITERVIHRHRRKWLIAFAVVVVLALLILVTGGWKKKEGRLVDTLPAPATVKAGQFEYGITTAKVIRTPEAKYSPAKARLEVSMDIRNVDEETRESDSVQGKLLVLVRKGQDPVASNGATCRGELNYRIVYGLPAVPCFAKFDVPADFSAEEVEIGVVAQVYESDESLIGSDEPYWQGGEAMAVVKVPATTETESGR